MDSYSGQKRVKGPQKDENGRPPVVKHQGPIPMLSSASHDNGQGGIQVLATSVGPPVAVKEASTVMSSPTT